MSAWGTERRYVARYLGSGVANTLVGFAVIFLLLWLGAGPVWANVGGYAFGIALGFLLSKKFVFRTERHLSKEGARYVAAFALAFLSNLLVLQVCIDKFGLHPFAAQVAAAATYTLLMYALSRYYVFAGNAFTEPPAG